MSDLDTLFPVPQTVQAGGKTIDVLPLKLRQLGAFTRALRPALVAMQDSGSLLLQGEDLVPAVAVASGEPVEWVAGLDAADYLRLATAVMEVNADFFVQLRLALEASNGLLNRLAGPMPSPNSPPAATVLPT
jgi:hypothetical protein